MSPELDPDPPPDPLPDPDPPPDPPPDPDPPFDPELLFDPELPLEPELLEAWPLYPELPPEPPLDPEFCVFPELLLPELLPGPGSSGPTGPGGEEQLQTTVRLATPKAIFDRMAILRRAAADAQGPAPAE
jgi:eukaryotic-like serine/threonine-protein kinase